MTVSLHWRLDVKGIFYLPVEKKNFNLQGNYLARWKLFIFKYLLFQPPTLAHLIHVWHLISFYSSYGNKQGRANPVNFLRCMHVSQCELNKSKGRSFYHLGWLVENCNRLTIRRGALISVSIIIRKKIDAKRLPNFLSRMALHKTNF